MLKKIVVPGLVLSSLCVGGTALAQDEDVLKGFYLGGSITQARFDEENFSLDDVDDEDNSWKIIGGVRFHDNFAVEANYIDFGEMSARLATGTGPFSAEAKGFAVFGVGPNNFGTAEGRLSPFADRQQYGIGVRWNAPHNSFIQVGAELGVPGLVLFVGMIASTFVALRRLVRRRPAPIEASPASRALQSSSMTTMSQTAMLPSSSAGTNHSRPGLSLRAQTEVSASSGPVVPSSIYDVAASEPRGARRSASRTSSSEKSRRASQARWRRATTSRSAA